MELYSTIQVAEWLESWMNDSASIGEWSCKDLEKIIEEYYDLEHAKQQYDMDVEAGVYDQNKDYLAGIQTGYDQYIDYTDDGNVWRAGTARNNRITTLIKASPYTWDELLGHEPKGIKLPGKSELYKKFEEWVRQTSKLAIFMFPEIHSSNEFDEINEFLCDGYADNSRYLWTDNIRDLKMQNVSGYNLGNHTLPLIAKIKTNLLTMWLEGYEYHCYERRNITNRLGVVVACLVATTPRGSIILTDK